MQATTATFLAGGSGRSPLSKLAAYSSLLREQLVGRAHPKSS